LIEREKKTEKKAVTKLKKEKEEKKAV
jgi:hypothetical protein